MTWFLLKLVGVGRWLKTLPWQVYAALGVLALIFVGVQAHGCAVKRAYDAAYAAGSDASDKNWQDAYDEMAETAKDWRLKYDATAALVAKDTGERHAQEVRDVASAADALRVRGPGAAEACRRPDNPAGLPTTSGGPVVARGAEDAPVSGVSEAGLAILPWSDIVDFGAAHDSYRSEVTTWREWYSRQAQLWVESKAELQR